MTSVENDMQSMMAEAERLGREQTELDERNRKRRAKGRKPIPDLQDKLDGDVLKRRYRTGDATTVAAADAVKLFEMRKAAMNADSYDYDDEDDDEPQPAKKPEKEANPVNNEDEKAVREAAAARRVQDMKNGRIDHESNWSPGGQQLEGGDKTEFPSVAPPREDNAQAAEEIRTAKNLTVERWNDTPPDIDRKDYNSPYALLEWLEEFKKDLYNRLKISFEGIENTLSDLQGRVAEIVTASAKAASGDDDDSEDSDDGISEDSFREMLSQSTQVTFDVSGTRMTFDAICVFHAAPCITVVSKLGTATITPKPGTALNMTYNTDGIHYENDPVVFLGTRFELPMFGLSFVGFVRTLEADIMDAGEATGK